MSSVRVGNYFSYACVYTYVNAFFTIIWSAYHVSSQVDTEDGDGAQRQRDIDNNEEQEGGDLRDVAGQGVRNGFLQIIKDESACKGIKGLFDNISPVLPCTPIH